MKKIVKCLFLTLITGIAFIFSMTTTNAAAPDSIVITSAGPLNAYIGNSKIGVQYLADGTIVYCLDKPKKNPKGVTLYRKGELDSGIAWLIENGWPNKSFTGDNNKDGYLMQAAIWWYLDITSGMSNLSYDFKNNSSDPHDLKRYIHGLIDASIQARNRGYVNPSMSLKANSTLLKKVNSEYFESDLITLNSTNVSGNYTVSLTNKDSNIKIVDASGKERNTFAQNEGFKVRVYKGAFEKSLTVSIDLTAKATGFINKAYRYESTDSKYQPAVISVLYPEYHNLQASIKLTGTSTKVSISKQDITTKKELPGAQLVVKDKNGKVIDKWTSTTQPHIIKNITPGTYTLTETIAPKEYLLSNETITFTVKADGKVSSVVMYNTKSSTIKISKQDITTKKELPGAQLVVKDQNGKVIDKWTSTKEPHVIKNIKPGTYTLTETIAPDGYILSNETITFTVKADGKVKSIVMYNAKAPSVKISKQDITTKKELPGAQLVVKDKNGKVIDKWTSTKEPHVIKNIKPGTYTLTETIAPDGYILSTEVISFTIKADSTVKSVVMYNTKSSTIKISKQDITTKKELPGAHLVVKDKNGKIIDEWTSTDEPHIIENVKPGTYTLTETIAPKGYLLSEEVITFEVKAGESIVPVVMYNTQEIIDVPITDSNISPIVYLLGCTLIVGSSLKIIKYARN